MKKVIVLLIGILFMNLGTANLLAQDEEASRSISNEFNVNENAILKLHSKYGEVKIENWDKNQVAIHVDMQVEAKSKEKAEEILKDIEVDLSGSKNIVEAYVNLEKVNCKNNCKFEINMNIMMPASMSVDLLVEYGELHGEKINGPAKVGIKYGSMDFAALDNEDVNLYIKYSSASVDQMKNAKIEMAYSEFSVDKAEVLKMESAYCQIEIDQVRSIELESQYDEVDIDNCFSFAMDSKFTNVEIEELSKELLVEMDYGMLEVERINKSFNKIHLTTEYANASLDIDSDASYRLEGEAKYGNIHYPGNSKVSKETEGYTKFKYSGTIGSDQSPDSEVIIKCKNANVQL